MTISKAIISKWLPIRPVADRLGVGIRTSSRRASGAWSARGVVDAEAVLASLAVDALRDNRAQTA